MTPSRAEPGGHGVDVLTLPYDSGARAVRMGGGPLRILEAGLQHHLESEGHQVRHLPVELSTWDPGTGRDRGREGGDAPAGEATSAFDLARTLSRRVEESARSGRLPLVLAGGCISAVGTTAGLRGAIGSDPVVVWLDAHGDLHTPETTTSGFVDGTALATVTGRCWAALSATVPRFAPVPDDRVALVGARDLDPAEVDLLRRGGPAAVPRERIRADGAEAALEAALDAARPAPPDGSGEPPPPGAYLHVDLDVLDAGVARANALASPGGLTVDEVVEVARAVQARWGLAAAALTAYAPEEDPDGAACAAALEIATAVARARFG